MKLKRIEAGRYQSECGRVQIWREISRQTYHPDEICWAVRIDGYTYIMQHETLRDAREFARRVVANATAP